MKAKKTFKTKWPTFDWMLMSLTVRLMSLTVRWYLRRIIVQENRQLVVCLQLKRWNKQENKIEKNTWTSHSRSSRASVDILNRFCYTFCGEICKGSVVEVSGNRDSYGGGGVAIRGTSCDTVLLPCSGVVSCHKDAPACSGVMSRHSAGTIDRSSRWQSQRSAGSNGDASFCDVNKLVSLNMKQSKSHTHARTYVRTHARTHTHTRKYFKMLRFCRRKGTPDTKRVDFSLLLSCKHCIYLKCAKYLLH